MLFSKLGVGSSLCESCGRHEETTVHLFLQCPMAKAIAFKSRWGSRLDLLSVTDVDHLVSLCFDPHLIPGFQDFSKDFTLVFFATLFYYVWRFRNEKVFTRAQSLKQQIFLVEKVILEFLSLTDNGGIVQKIPFPQ